MVESEAPTADFAPGQEFGIFCTGPTEPYLVKDSAARIVAILPGGLTGHVQTRTRSWEVEIEQRRTTWAVVARTRPDRANAGSVTEGWVSFIHNLRVTSETDYRLIRKPFTATWTIRHSGKTLAQITDIRLFASRSDIFAGRNKPVGTIKTSATLTNPTSLALPIVLALALIKVEGSIPAAIG
jgi:hypothetical protein